MGKEGLVAPDLQTQDWQTLFLTEGGKAANKHGLYAKAEAPNQHSGMASRKESRTSDRLRQLPLYEHILAADVVNFVDSTFSERQKRLHLSARQMEQAKRGLLDKGLIKQVWVGKVLLLAPVEQLYFLLGMESPYRRNNWTSIPS